MVARENREISFHSLFIPTSAFALALCCNRLSAGNVIKGAWSKGRNTRWTGVNFREEGNTKSKSQDTVYKIGSCALLCLKMRIESSVWKTVNMS